MCNNDKKHETLKDWAIVQYPDIYKTIENPEKAFAKLNCGYPVALFGLATNDHRHNVETGRFADGHRIVTSPIIAVTSGKYETINTIYILDERDKNASFQKWCIENQCQEISLDMTLEKDCSMQDTVYWEIVFNKTPVEQLNERHKQTLRRIMAEPESILPYAKKLFGY